MELYSVDMENPKSWDEYFFNICKVVASNSKCLSRKIGAGIVRDKRVISTGYNGPPEGVRTCDNRWLIDPDMREHAYDNKTLDAKYWITIRSKIFKLNLENKCPRYVMGFKSGQGLEWCVAGHAERNAIVNAARMGFSTKGTKIYMTCGVPCSQCLVEIINSGIEEIIVTDVENSFYDQSAKYLLRESNIKIRTYDFIKE